MLIKLLKYDLKYMIKNMSVFYILSIFFAITTRILFNIEQSIIINILGQISVGFLFSIIASTFINTVMRSWIRFRDSLYKDEAYLTHTLPVTKNNLYNSKLIQTLIFFIISFIIILLSLFIAYYSKENWQLITNYIKTITTGLNMSTLFFVTIFIIIIFLEVFNSIQCGFFGIILGYRKNNKKIFYSIIYGFVSYFIVQFIILLLLLIFGLFNSSILELFKAKTAIIDTEVFKTLSIISSIFYLIIIYIISFICKKILNKGVNIE